MKDRIAAFIKAENKTSIQFAEEIGVQPSSISHIISGRNNPSLDFVIKMLNTYTYISTEWLLFGKGKMYIKELDPTLFDNDDLNNLTNYKSIDHEKLNDFDNSISNSILEPDKDLNFSNNVPAENVADDPENKEIKKSVEKIVWFYNDNSFKVFEAK